MADEAPQTSRLETLDDVVARVMARQSTVRLSGLRGAARGVFAAQLVRAHGERPVLVLVNGAVIVRDSQVQNGVNAGQQIRYPVEAQGRFDPPTREEYINTILGRDIPDLHDHGMDQHH